MAKSNFGKILVYSLPFIVGGVLLYSYIRKKKKLKEKSGKKPQPQSGDVLSIPETYDFTNKYTVSTSSGSLNVRSEPSTSSSVVSSLSKGATVFGGTPVNGWVEVSKDGLTFLGYASAQFLRKQTATTQPQQTTTSGTPNVGRPTNYNQSSAVSFPTKYVVSVSSGSNLNIRTNPRLDASILKKVPRGTILTGRASSVPNWIEITEDGSTVYGYASKNFLSVQI
jgi:uncharacterized protein YgiM (DUF1202 family)